MNEETKPNNTASIVVAILAIGLIVGAVFLINQTFSNSGSSSSSSSSQSSKSDDTIVITESSSSSSSSSSLSSVSSSSSSSSSQSSSLSSSSSSSSSNSSSSSSAKIETNQMTAELTSLAGGTGRFKVIQCGAQATIPSCKPGITVNLGVSAWKNLVAGKTYLITATFNQTGNGFTMDVSSITAQ